MTERERLRRHLDGAIAAICGVFALLLVGSLALWRAGKFWEQARWTLFETAIPAAAFVLLGVLYLVRAKRQIFSSQSNDPSEAPSS